MSERVFVIVGASLAGGRAAQTLREEGFDGRIVLVGAEPHLPYERPPLSKGYLLGKDERRKAFAHEDGYYAEQRIELRLGTRATAIDPGAHQVTLDGGETLGYDKLLLATGSSPRTLDLPGGEGPRIHYLRTIDESEALGATLRAGDPVVVIGAGWIGLEVAAAARGFGCDVTVVETDRAPLRQVVGDDVAAVFRALHEAHGVDFRFGTQVRELGGIGDRVTHAVLDDNTEVPASAALIAVGITPNVELARAAGLRVDNGVEVDAALRTSDPDIYACGDVASAYHPLFHQHIRVEHWANALNGGPDGAGRDGGKKTGKGAAVGDGGGAESSGERGQDTVSIEPRTPATGNGASGELPDRTEGIGSATPPVPSHERPAPPAAGDRSADPAPDGASQVKDPSGKDA